MMEPPVVVDGDGDLEGVRRSIDEILTRVDTVSLLRLPTPSPFLLSIILSFISPCCYYYSVFCFPSHSDQVLNCGYCFGHSKNFDIIENIKLWTNAAAIAGRSFEDFEILDVAYCNLKPCVSHHNLILRSNIMNNKIVKYD